MRKITFSLFILTFGINHSFSQTPPVAGANQFLSGKTLLDMCNQNDRYCATYIMGVLDAFINDDLALETCSFALPIGIKGGALNAMTIKFLKDNPDQLKYGAAGLISNLFSKTFPCPEK